MLWFSMHGALSSVYVPFPVALLGADVELPLGYTHNSVSRADRGVGAWQAARFVFTAAQLHFNIAIKLVRSSQHLWEAQLGEAAVSNWTAGFVSGELSASDISHGSVAHAVAATSAWWDLSDQLLLPFNYPAVTYPTDWVQAPVVAYADGPPPSPEVPLPPTGFASIASLGGTVASA